MPGFFFSTFFFFFREKKIRACPMNMSGYFFQEKKNKNPEKNTHACPWNIRGYLPPLILSSKWFDSVLKMIGKFWTRHLAYHSHELARTYPTNSPYFSLRGPAVALDTPSAEGASCYMGEKVHNNYLMGLIFSTSWSVPPRKKNSLWGYDF